MDTRFAPTVQGQALSLTAAQLTIPRELGSLKLTISDTSKSVGARNCTLPQNFMLPYPFFGHLAF